MDLRMLKYIGQQDECQEVRNTRTAADDLPPFSYKIDW